MVAGPDSGDHILCIGDLGAFRRDYPEWGLTYDIEGILRQRRKRRALAATGVNGRLARLAGPAIRLQTVLRFDAGRDDLPSPHAKRRHLLRLLRDGGHTRFVEAGTYRGDTVAFFVGRVAQIVSVEIDPALYEAARRRFINKPSVEVLLGDATDVIPRVLDESDESTLLFLDGHYSGGVTGRGDEIEPAPTILQRLSDRKGRAPLTTVVDDLRLFGRDADYPTLDTLLAQARRAFPTAEIRVGLDSLVIVA